MFSGPKMIGMVLILLIAGWFIIHRSNESAKAPEVALMISNETVALPAFEMEDPALVIDCDEAELAPTVTSPSTLRPISDDTLLPKDVDRISQLFQPYPPLLPIVETVDYSSKVSWLTGRSAYLGDYASHYQTSKYFISRSLKGMGNYLSEAVSKGDRFNVFRKDKEIQFHLVLDLSRLKMWFYYYDTQSNDRVLLKTYPVCVGRLDASKVSGCLTPTGVFKLGKEVGVYKPGTLGLWRQQQKEMVSVFGVRWIPFEREIANCTGSCKGLGFHGVPWKKNMETDGYLENKDCIGHYESGGCVRLRTDDIEELFAIVISKPSYVHIVRDFQEAKLPGKEKI